MRTFRPSLALACLTAFVAITCFAAPGELCAADSEPAPGLRRPTSGFGRVDRSGRNELIFHSSIAGPVIGAAISGFVNPDLDNTESLSGPILGLAAGVFFPLWLTWSRDVEVTSGDVVFTNFALRWGGMTGVQLATAIRPQSRRTRFGGFAALATGAAVAGGYWAFGRGYQPGQAAAMSTFHHWASIAGWSMAVVADGEVFGHAQGAASVAAGNLALLTAAWLLPKLDVDRSRFVWMDAAGAAGFGAGWGVAFLVERGDEAIAAGAGLGGAVLGLATAFLLTRNSEDYDRRAPIGKAPMALRTVRMQQDLAGEPAALELQRRSERPRTGTLLPLFGGEF